MKRRPGVPSFEWLREQVTVEPCPSQAGDCWTWPRPRPDGYGYISIHGRETPIYRLAYELKWGPVECWLVLDHLCRNRACINPAHLEPVTQAENIRRGMAPNVVAARTGVCSRGHALEPVGGRMRCKVCHAERSREWYLRKKAKTAPLLGLASVALLVLR